MPIAVLGVNVLVLVVLLVAMIGHRRRLTLNRARSAVPRGS
ncbi:hypothetical protein AB0N31_33580 [Streptomyces sp. NPDC051051]